MIGKAEVTIIADYDVFVNHYSHNPAGKYQLACNRDIILRGFGVSGGMIMGKN